MQFQFSPDDLLAALPVLALAGWGIVILLFDLVAGARHRPIMGMLAMSGLATSMLALIILWQKGAMGFGMLTFDGLALFLSALGVMAAALTVAASTYVRRRRIERGEYYALLLFSTAGMALMVAGADLIVIFLGLELLSIPLYILAGFARPQPESEEAALKYFLLGAFGSGFLVYGIALVYGASGATSLATIKSLLHDTQYAIRAPLLLVGSGLMLVGLGFKIAAVPFHMWTPDVYEGSPTPVAGFMSVIAKLAGLAALARVFIYGLGELYIDWRIIIAILAALTMIVGNVAAIAQSNLKRMLAYSSIAHAGYLLMGIATGNAPGLAALLFYLVAYTFANIGAFAALAALSASAPTPEDQSLSRYAGLMRARPWVAAAMIVFMLSLTGIPPTAGFFGKYYLFAAALRSNLLWLVIIGLLTSLIGAFYYLRVVIIMTMQEPEHEWPTMSSAYEWVLWITALGTLLVGMLPGPWLAAVQAISGFGF